ncbi:MAG: energy transducer TonB [Acidobacteria bacterium]|nr:energy transducer TonB [Acidobacteriota bacterium]
MEALLGEDGRVRNITIKSEHPSLAPAARDAVAQWVYEPTLLNGEPYPVVLEVKVRFYLQR